LIANAAPDIENPEENIPKAYFQSVIYVFYNGEGIVVYFEIEELDAYVNKLIGEGIEFEELPKDQVWLWREARLKDVDGNQLILYYAGENRKNPPWRLGNKKLKKMLFPELESERLRLRGFTINDKYEMFNVYAHSEVVKHYDLDAMKDVNEAKEIIDLFIHRFNNNIGIRWAITLKETDEYIGDIGFNVFDREIQSVDLGYAINPKHWNKGYATEALQLVINFGFYDFKTVILNRIEARVMEGNKASLHLLKKFGFFYEGKLRDTTLKNGQLHDTHIYSMLRNEYTRR